MIKIIRAKHFLVSFPSLYLISNIFRWWTRLRQLASKQRIFMIGSSEEGRISGRRDSRASDA